MNTGNIRAIELNCKCGCKPIDIDPTLMVILQMVRSHFGKPLIVTSGYRCKAHNKRVGGSKASSHCNGIAADFKINGVSPAAIYDYLNSNFPTSLGLGLYSTWVHVDTRHDKAYRW